MPREIFELELKKLQDELLALGNMVEGAITESVEALKQRDLERSRRLIDYDQRINEKRFDIEHQVLTLIATQQPMAVDMRFLAGILEIVTELERMGDYAKGIAKINLMIGDEEPLIKPLIDVPLMAEKARHMLERALDAFVNRDVKLAREIPATGHEDHARHRCGDRGACRPGAGPSRGRGDRRDGDRRAGRPPPPRGPGPAPAPPPTGSGCRS